MAPLPRPILKRAASAPSTVKHAVHFPPSPALTKTFVAHSSAAYDRSPIVVSPNTCALPERGGRTYILDDPPTPSTPTPTDPRRTRPLAHPSHIASIPSLIPDLSSEDDSDGFPSPPLENQEFFFGPSNPHGLKSSNDASIALSFLPHAPSNPYYPPTTEDGPQLDKPRRRKERKHDAYRDGNRIRTISDDRDDDDDDVPTPRRKSSKTRSPTFATSSSSTFSPSLSLCDSFSSFGLRDDGCLGGF